MRYHKGFKFGDRIIWPPYGAERCTCPQAVKAYEEEKAAKAAEEYGMPGNLVAGANIAGFLKVADAMIWQGVSY